MRYHEYHFRWEWNLQSSPEALWPIVSDTGRFNRDTGAGGLEELTEDSLTNARHRLRIQAFGRPFEWIEEPYEWVKPYRFSAGRKYTQGLVAEGRSATEMIPLPGGGTRLIYELWIRPNNLIGAIGIPLQVRLFSGKIYERIFHDYDRRAKVGETLGLMANDDVTLASGGHERLMTLRGRLLDEGAAPELVDVLVGLIENGDDLSLIRIRPYVLADYLEFERRKMLELCLVATRIGMLNLHWDVLCPNCRGAKLSAPMLGGIRPQVHCNTCNIDFTANFERSVELTFRPNSSIREVREVEFCMAGPQVTPHIGIQQLMKPGDARTITPVLEEGRYRLRTLHMSGGQYFQVGRESINGGADSVTFEASAEGWPSDEPVIAPQADIHLINATTDEQLFIVERMAWGDQAVTAAEVTTMQIFRDLFSSEALRPGDQISVGKLTILFTDLRGSTGLYREVGDASAFGMVMEHFDVLKSAIAAEQGAIVKTIGDAVMAVFSQPDAAVRATIKAQQDLAHPKSNQMPLKLKAGIHTGGGIAVTLNERLDYFGSTVNMAARLESFSTGQDVVISSDVYFDPGVTKLLRNPAFEAASFQAELKGFGETQFELWRISANAPLTNINPTKPTLKTIAKRN